MTSMNSSTGDLDATAADAPLRVMMVCTGNICRSPMAEVVLRSRLRDLGLVDRVVVDSTGVSSEEQGNPIDSRARTALWRRGYAGSDVAGHRARRVQPAELGERDLVLAMTAHHAATLRRLAPDDADRVRMFRSFDPATGTLGRDSDLDVADPWYGGPEDFELCLDEVEAAVDGLLSELRTRLASGAAPRAGHN